MNVSLQNIDKVNALLIVKMGKADYQEKVDKALKDLRHKAQMPGFRKGMVPASLIKKMYGRSVLVEEVNKLLGEVTYNYIKENNVNMLGEPVPNEDQQVEIDFDTMEDFEFKFDIALAPEFKVEVSAADKVDYYDIEVTDEMVDNQVKSYTQRNGKYDKVDVYADNDMLKGLLAELDEQGNTKEGGIQVEGAVMMPSYMKNDEQKAIFTNAKVNDVLVFNPHTAWDGNPAELASLLKIDKEAAAEVKSNFSYQVEEITRFVPGDLNQEIFDQVFGEGVVKTEEEFRQSLAFVDKIDFYETHIFKYSKREGTKAARMDGQIDEQVKTARSAEMIELDRRKRKAYEQKFIGKTVDVLVEEDALINGEKVQTGHTKEYIKIAVKSSENLKNCIVKVQIENDSQIIR